MDRELSLNIHNEGFDIVVSEGETTIGVIKAYELANEIIYPDSGPQNTFEYNFTVKSLNTPIKPFRETYTDTPLSALNTACDIAEKL